MSTGGSMVGGWEGSDRLTYPSPRTSPAKMPFKHTKPLMGTLHTHTRPHIHLHTYFYVAHAKRGSFETSLVALQTLQTCGLHV